MPPTEAAPQYSRVSQVQKRVDESPLVSRQNQVNQFESALSYSRASPLTHQDLHANYYGQKSNHGFFFLEQIANMKYWLSGNRSYNDYVSDCMMQYKKTSDIFFSELDTPQARTDLSLKNTMIGQGK